MSGSAAVRAAAPGAPSGLLRDLYELTKPRIVQLILLTTAGAMGMAADGVPDPRLLLWTLLGTGLCAAAGGVLNCYIDRDIDALMRRTRQRPLPAGRLQPGLALAYGLVLGLAGAGVLLWGVNPLATALALGGMLYYVLVYSWWLKRRTPQNIVIGGAAGAAGPLIGWAAVTGQLELPAWFLFVVIFLWTPPHFWALALLTAEDYRQAGVPMLPVVRGPEVTRRQIVAYTLLLVLVSLLPLPLGMSAGPVYLLAAVGLGAVFVALSLRLWRHPSRERERRVFLYSLLYLALLFTAAVWDLR